jgi:hypothetical protein
MHRVARRRARAERHCDEGEATLGLESFPGSSVHIQELGRFSMCRTALDARLICTWRIDLARIERFSIMKLRRTSRSAPRGLRQTISVYHLVGAALPLALSGCSSDDPASQASPDVSMLAPAPNASAEAPAAEGSNEENAPVMDGVTPVATAGEGQQATDLDLAMPEPAPSGDPGAAGAPSVSPTGCVGQAWPTADPTSPGPFEVTADRGIGPQAGIVPDRIFGNVQQRFNIYRPSNLATSGLCHPILVWANGTGDNPEQRPPECIVEPSTNTWCGTYPGLMNQLASHGFVVMASLSTDTAAGDPLPTITGLDWLLEQAEDPSSPYYHRLDTTRVGAFGHSQGGASTSIAAADPRISAIAPIHGTRALNGLNGPALFICGELDTAVTCASVANTYRTVTEQPAVFLNNLAADHGSWLGQGGSQGPTFFALTAWFRVHLMDDVDNRRFFFGEDCALCTDSRVTIERNGLMNQ